MNFTQKLKQAIISSNSTLCVGLDPDPDMIPLTLKEEFPDSQKQITEFCRRIIESTKIHVCAYKPNMAFFEALGKNGWFMLDEIADMIPSNRIFIADAKRGDIGNTAKKYKETFFDQMGADAVTLNPLMGLDTLSPFLEDEKRAVFVLTMTSNKGSEDFLQRRFENRVSLGAYIAEKLSKLNEKSNCHLGMVVGATQPEAIQPVIKSHPHAHLLIPGIGSQGGSIEKLAQTLEGHIGIPIINSSRAIIYAGGDRTDWTEHVAEKAVLMKESIKMITERYV
ncbi:MAG: orotidine-5'-phosphate decarboxylase [Balneolaceae bacterium]